MTTLPILYSFRRCPWAMRARIALHYAGIQCILREVDLKNKPAHMLEISPKGTVPTLLLPDGTVIAESLDIMLHALQQHDPDGWAEWDEATQADMDVLIRKNDTEFAPALQKYKYFEKHPEHPQEYYCTQTEEILIRELEARLENHSHFIGDRPSLADAALFPLLRQFAMVDKKWFATAPYPKLRAWLNDFLENPHYTGVMQKHAPWQEGDAEILLIEG